MASVLSSSFFNDAPALAIFKAGWLRNSGFHRGKIVVETFHQTGSAH